MVSSLLSLLNMSRTDALTGWGFYGDKEAWKIEERGAQASSESSYFTGLDTSFCLLKWLFNLRLAGWQDHEAIKGSILEAINQKRQRAGL
ncbi:hypothetical protein NHX12_022278 [Muraenolepis orangiensis]|uniref:Uncharacterized protein n=1 Tax=Muraenolepis orangiensis TaxID=630683 RepID=A0A9Q0EN24_9TELE|nr:hypothetical protein NHX12_022278 [Muraenolepis orangiensis]